MWPAIPPCTLCVSLTRTLSEGNFESGSELEGQRPHWSCMTERGYNYREAFYSYTDDVQYETLF